MIKTVISTIKNTVGVASSHADSNLCQILQFNKFI